MAETETAPRVADGVLDEPKVSGDGGDYWPGKPGVFKFQFDRLEKGPQDWTQKRKRKNADGVEEEVEVPNPQARWVFKVFKHSGERVTYTAEDGRTLEAEFDGLTSYTISEKSNAGKYLKALLARDIDFANEKRADLINEALDTFATAVLGQSDNSDRIRIKALERLED